MNIIMKRLTIISIALMFPTFITGFFGMNVRLPYQNAYFAWIFLLIICIAVAIIGSVIISGGKNSEKKPKKKKKKEKKER